MKRRLVYSFDHDHGEPASARRELLGGKGANLAEMTSLGLAVPPGFTITTDACRLVLDAGWPDVLDELIDEQLALLGERLGRRYGDPRAPLLLSVRSGAPVSMPGMLDTVLNLGLNQATQEGLARRTGSPQFAEDCRRRLDAMYRSTVGAAVVPQDPAVQLRQAIEAVFRSWEGPRASSYRRREAIAEQMGTAVNVQAMVFGNLDHSSGTGVCFSRDPSTGEPELYGDVLMCAQGEDVVGGTRTPEPLVALNRLLPAVATELERTARLLERHLADLVDIEFTIESGRLWILQVRAGKRSARAALRIALDMAQDPDFPLSPAAAIERVRPQLLRPPRVTLRRPGLRVLTTGLPASPGSASGVVVFDPDEAVRHAEEGTPVVLVRAETSPADVHGIARAAGLVTATGGLASHAAVVARGWGIPAVVGADGLAVGEGEAFAGDKRLVAGDHITVDGDTGEVLEGHGVIDGGIMAEATTMLCWADELGITVEDVPAGVPQVEVPPERVDLSGAGSPPAGDPLDLACLFLAVRSVARADELRSAVAVGSDEVSRLAEDGLGLLESIGGSNLRLTDAGRARAEDLFADARAEIGTAAAERMLDEFVELDREVKRVVTSWQLRDDGEVQVPNDHADAAYDREVLDELVTCHHEAEPWLCGLDALPAIPQVRRRLKAACELVVSGDHRYVASPLVDSYHSVWFELHEYLIRLAGRSRQEEARAGRAG
ncbi:MAG: hypothetical protein JJLCMIEE_01111 [Acidimicrobiales bacterium]|nr:MAG: pyruvate, phosphate dikinase [Actinomycetota bacterium]MBV6508052.1 hypothetical protein [Acidimicrobiales bacterium]RIK05320.1 MAG: pyruvate, phosphate dikinase [Acidobacteriota bacterium]